jgi:deoxyhypusine monooxygenase
MRTHAAFKLRTIGSAECATVIAEALANREDSSLMRHELAYILGQMQHPHVCEVLSQILEDEYEDLLVRHESAEVSA